MPNIARPHKENFDGYLAVPVAARDPGVIVLHAWWGLTAFFRQRCDRLAGAGFAVYAPNLYRGAMARTIEQANWLRSRMDRDAAERKVKYALEYLQSQPAVQGLRSGVIGLSVAR